MSKLKAKKPTQIDKKLKLFLYAASGIGKTTAALQFPSAYIIDTERGCENYAGMINDAKSVVFQSSDHHDIHEQVEALLTNEHEYKTLIIDPITVLYLSIQEHWTRKFEKQAREKDKPNIAEMQDFGMRYWGKVKSNYKALQRMILRLDMNVIVTAHQKDVYGTNANKIGVSFDSMKGDDYFFDYVFRLEKRGKDRIAITEKERAEIGKNKFPEEFKWSYDNFIKYYGKIIEKKATPLKLATPEQVKHIQSMVNTINIGDDVINKWFSKAGVSDFKEMTEDQISKCIDFCDKKLEVITKQK